MQKRNPVTIWGPSPNILALFCYCHQVGAQLSANEPLEEHKIQATKPGMFLKSLELFLIFSFESVGAGSPRDDKQSFPIYTTRSLSWLEARELLHPLVSALCVGQSCV